MFQHIEIIDLTRILAQAPAISPMQAVPIDPTVAGTRTAAAVFSGPQFFVTLISGLVLAFATQLVLTNLSVAAGISYLGHKSDPDSHDESGSLGGTMRKIGTAVGLWTLFTVSISLLFACFLAVKLSIISSAGLGAILGLVIWGAYFSLLVWVSSSTVGSLVGSVINAATSGFQSIIGTATAAMGAKSMSNQVVATAEAAAAAVRKEFTSGFDPESIRETVEDYFHGLKLPELDLSNIRKEFEKMLNDPDLKALAASGDLSNIDRKTFVKLVSSRTDFSKKEINGVVDQLEKVWYQVLGRKQDPITELRGYLSSAQPEKLKSGELGKKLDDLLEQVRSSKQVTDVQSSAIQALQSGQKAVQGNQSDQPEQQAGLMDRAIQYGLSTLVGTVMSRTDLSNIDVEKITSQLQNFKQKLTSQSAGSSSGNGNGNGKLMSLIPGLPKGTIAADVENYLANSYSWHLNRETIKQEFKEVLYDPQADPGSVRRQVEGLNRARFVDLLSQRGIFTQDRINEIADQLESVRLEVLSTVQSGEDQEYSQDLRTRVENYLRHTGKPELNPEAIEREFKLLLDDPSAGFDALRNRLSQLDRDTLVQLLKQRSDLVPEEAAQVLTRIEGVRDRVLSEAQNAQEQAKSKAAAAQQRVEDYLRHTGKDELNPDGIKRDLGALFQDPQLGLSAIRSRLSHFDRDTFVQLLSQRQDISPEEANRILDHVEENWNILTHAPQIVGDKAKEQYDKTTAALSEYLRRTNLEELNPEGIQRDLSLLVHDPKEGALALRQRLSHVDRETLVKLLSQRDDLTEEQVNQIIDQVQDVIQTLIKAPRRFASRTQERVKNFQDSLAGYLRNTDREELNPDAIKRDLQLLLHDPKAGLGSLSERLSHFDRATLVSLLSQRKDISEEDANRTVDQVLAVRDQAVEQVRMVQRRIQSVVDSIFARIRDYLNALERPELNYEGIQRDLRTTFNDPQAGFEALRDRLGHFNRETVVALLSSREDISEADANRIIDQVDGARQSVLRRAERIQHEAQRRLEDVKRQAKKQAEETRKAAEAASWWLFGTAIVSAAFSALGGYLAVTTAGLTY